MDKISKIKALARKNGITSDNMMYDDYINVMDKEYSVKEIDSFLKTGVSGRPIIAFKPNKNKKGGKIKSKYSTGGGVRTAKYKV